MENFMCLVLNLITVHRSSQLVECIEERLSSSNSATEHNKAYMYICSTLYFITTNNIVPHLMPRQVGWKHWKLYKVIICLLCAHHVCMNLWTQNGIFEESLFLLLKHPKAISTLNILLRNLVDLMWIHLVDSTVCVHTLSLVLTRIMYCCFVDCARNRTSQKSPQQTRRRLPQLLWRWRQRLYRSGDLQKKGTCVWVCVWVGAFRNINSYLTPSVLGHYPQVGHGCVT